MTAVVTIIAICLTVLTLWAAHMFNRVIEFNGKVIEMFGIIGEGTDGMGNSVEQLMDRMNRVEQISANAQAKAIALERKINGN